MMMRWTTAVLTVLFLCAGTAPVSAQKDAVKKPLGTWTRMADQFSMTLEIEPDALKITLKVEANSIVVHADYGMSKDGVVFARMNKVDKKGVNDGPEAGELFSFKFKVNGGELTLEDLQGTKVNDEARQIVHGVYKKK